MQPYGCATPSPTARSDGVRSWRSRNPCPVPVIPLGLCPTGLSSQTFLTGPISCSGETLGNSAPRTAIRKLPRQLLLVHFYTPARIDPICNPYSTLPSRRLEHLRANNVNSHHKIPPTDFFVHQARKKFSNTTPHTHCLNREIGTAYGHGQTELYKRK